MDNQPEVDRFVGVTSMLGAKLYHPQATVGALVSAVSDSKTDLTVLLVYRAEADALAEQLLAESKRLQLLPPDLEQDLEAFAKETKRLADAAVSITQTHGLPTPDQIGLLVFAMAMSPGRSDESERAAGGTLIDQIGKSRKHQEQLDAHARMVCRAHACLEAYETSLKAFDDAASLAQ